MERLQAAITKARKRQNGLPQTRNQLETPALWNTLPELALDGSTLVRNRIVTMEASSEATPFDMLRTRTLRIMQENGWRRIAITSPTPACGKSTISLNLAFSIARQPNTRAIEIEADMRQPSQNRLLGIAGKNIRCRSVGDVLNGRTTFSDTAVRCGSGLALVTSEKPIPNASDVLLGAGVGEALAQIEAGYQPDVVIFDMPPVLVNDDAMAFVQHVDCVLIVAAAERTTISEIDRCERELASQTNVLGVVLNKCDFTPSEYGTYGY